MKDLLTTILIATSFLFPAISFSQDMEDEKMKKYMKQWNKLIPKQVKLQFAGSMGMFSLGSGWFYGKSDQWETDLFIGFIPRIDDIKGHLTITLKQTFTPFRFQLNDAITYEPLTSGVYINKIFGPYFWNKLPDKYPKNYYFWATNTRFHVFLGQSFGFKWVKASPDTNWSFFYELNTNDLYIVSAIGNKSISLNEIVGLSFGLRYRLF